MVWRSSSNLQTCLESAYSFKICRITFRHTRCMLIVTRKRDNTWLESVSSSKRLFPALLVYVLQNMFHLKVSLSSLSGGVWHNLKSWKLFFQERIETHKLQRVFSQIQCVFNVCLSSDHPHTTERALKWFDFRTVDNYVHWSVAPPVDAVKANQNGFVSVWDISGRNFTTLSLLFWVNSGLFSEWCSLSNHTIS